MDGGTPLLPQLRVSDLQRSDEMNQLHDEHVNLELVVRQCAWGMGRRHAPFGADAATAT